VREEFSNPHHGRAKEIHTGAVRRIKHEHGTILQVAHTRADKKTKGDKKECLKK
jgi:hypothetical protein